MAIDIISELDPKDLNEFKKDFTELIRVYSGINREYSKLGKDIDKYIAEFKQIVNMFNKKYKNLVLRLKKTINELQLRIFIKEKSVKDVFINVGAKLEGLKAVGTTDFGKAKIEEADRFSKELDKVKNKLFVSYFEKESTDIFLEKSKKGMVELHYGKDIGSERLPSFKLCSYYAVKGGVGKVNIDERLSAIGFTEIPILERVRNFFKKFNPRIEE